MNALHVDKSDFGARICAWIQVWVMRNIRWQGDCSQGSGRQHREFALATQMSQISN
jgi:hypothetical protein